MRRLCSLILLAALFGAPLTLATAGAALCAETQQPAPKAQPAKKKTSKRSQRSQAERQKQAKNIHLKLTREPSAITEEDLRSPYTATQGAPRPDPMKAAEKEAQQDPRLRFDPTPKEGPFAPAGEKKQQQQKKKVEDDGPVSFRVGPEKVIDPLTGEEVKRQDSSSSKDKNDIKGAMDKVGGKAEMQVDILKF